MEDALRLLDESLLVGGPVRIAVISGPAEMGKTVLALRWAARTRVSFPGGLLCVDFPALRDQDGPVVSDAVALCLRDLGVREELVPWTLRERAALFRSLTAGTPVLVVLDDATEPAQVLPLVPAAAGSVVVVTSRRRLGELALDGALLLSLGPDGVLT